MSAEFSKILAVRLAVISILTFAFFILPFSAFAVGQPLGFIEARSQSPLQQLRFGPIHHLPWVLPDKSHTFSISHNWKNMWLDKSGAYHIDAEIQELIAQYRIGLGGGIEIGAELPVRYVSGGILDGLIEDFHKSFGIDNAGRDKYPRNSFAFAINNGAGVDGWSATGAEQEGWNLGNAILEVSADLGSITGDQFPAILTFEMKLPTGTRTEFFGSQKIDYSLSLSTAARTGSLHWYFGSAVTHYGDYEMIDIELRRWHFSNLIGMEYTTHGGTQAWIVQLLAETGVARDFYQFSDATYEMMFGHKRRLSDKVTLEVGILENVLAFDNSPDIGLHTAVTFQL